MTSRNLWLFLLFVFSDSKAMHTWKEDLMSERAERPSEQGDEPLFQNMEEQERTYSPQAVPGSNIPDVERDKGGTATQGSAVASDEGEQETT